MMGEVLYNFRSFTKLSAITSSATVPMEEFDIKKLLGEVAMLVQPRANVPIVVDVTGNGNVITSKFYLKTVLYNLCG
jgi:hypothetical protein